MRVAVSWIGYKLSVRTLGRAAATALLLVLPLAARSEPETRLANRVWVRPLTAHTWLVRSVSALGGFGEVESNAVLVTGRTESVLIDTPATNEQTEPVLAWAEGTLHRPVRHLIVTHWHADRTGGLGVARARKVALYAFRKTRALARQHGHIVPDHEIGREAHLTISGIALETWYPGHGHTDDNIVVWLPDDGLLDGACFVKSVAATDLGNVEEVDPVQWAKGVAALRLRYPGARTVVPGHGATGGAVLLAHTAALLAANPD